MDVFQIVLAVLCGLVALSLVVEIVRNAPVGNVSFFGLVAIEIGLFAQLFWGVGRVIDDAAGVEVGTYLGYLVGALVLLPAGFIWSASEKSRGGTAVLLVAVLVTPVLLLRLHDIWALHA